MAKPIEFLSKADEELVDALRWYQDIDPELATLFATAVGDAVEQIAQFPGAGHPVPGRCEEFFFAGFRSPSSTVPRRPQS